MIRLDDDRYIDTSLITHAEYQLFLDEQRGQGRYYQPDHWRTYQFPAGQAHTPVLGVRPSDAEAFCQWLSQREADDWRYRLPYARELSADLQAANGCYWAQTDSTLVKYVLRGDNEVVTRQTQLERVLAGALDRARARARDLDLDRALARALDRARALDLALAHNVDRSLAHDLTRALMRAPAQAHDSSSQRATAAASPQ